MATINPKEGEKVLVSLRKSIFSFYKEIAILALMLIAAGVLLITLYKYPTAQVAGSIVLFISFLYAFYYFIIWFYNVYIITNARIVSVTRKGLFSRRFSEVDHDMVLDVSYHITGFLPTILHFGTVVVKAQNDITMELTSLTSPGRVQEVLKNLVDATKRKNGQK